MDTETPVPQGLLYRGPLIGLMALAAGFLGQWFRHAVFPIAKTAFGSHYYWALIALGFIGVVLIWRGLNQAEIPATWKGYLGGLFIWVGWFEWGFHFFADAFNVQPYQATQRLVSTPDLNMVQASFPIFIAIFLVYGLFNRESRCNMMRWIHRNTPINPGTPTPGYQRSFARVTALETIFVIWFCYAIWLLLTYFGKSMPLLLGVFALWAVWFVYIAWRLMRITRPGHAFRYGIAVGIIGWVLVALPSHMRLFPVIWLKPFDYPLSTLAAAAAFIAAMVVFATSRDVTPDTARSE